MAPCERNDLNLSQSRSPLHLTIAHGEQRQEILNSQRPSRRSFNCLGVWSFYAVKSRSPRASFIGVNFKLLIWDGWIKICSFVPQIELWKTWARWTADFVGHHFHCFSFHMDLWEKHTDSATQHTVKKKAEEEHYTENSWSTLPLVYTE